MIACWRGLIIITTGICTLTRLRLLEVMMILRSNIRLRERRKKQFYDFYFRKSQTNLSVKTQLCVNES